MKLSDWYFLFHPFGAMAINYFSLPQPHGRIEIESVVKGWGLKRAILLLFLLLLLLLLFFFFFRPDF